MSFLLGMEIKSLYQHLAAPFLPKSLGCSRLDILKMLAENFKYFHNLVKSPSINQFFYWNAVLNVGIHIKNNQYFPIQIA